MSSNSVCNHTRGHPILLITRMITDRIELHSVILPLSTIATTTIITTTTTTTITTTTTTTSINTKIKFSFLYFRSLSFRERIQFDQEVAAYRAKSNHGMY